MADGLWRVVQAWAGRLRLGVLLLEREAVYEGLDEVRVHVELARDRVEARRHLHLLRVHLLRRRERQTRRAAERAEVLARREERRRLRHRHLQELLARHRRQVHRHRRHMLLDWQLHAVSEPAAGEARRQAKAEVHGGETVHRGWALGWCHTRGALRPKEGHLGHRRLHRLLHQAERNGHVQRETVGVLEEVCNLLGLLRGEAYVRTSAYDHVSSSK
jgi:hypothetical protein